MQIPLGRILFIDMGIERWGRVLYMVVRSPIRCTNCGTKIDDWKKDEQGYIECPYCE